MKPNRLRWGVLFIGLGITLLLYNTGTLEGWYFLDLLHLWPLLLVAVGIEIMARNSTLPALGYLSPLVIAAAFFWAGYAGDDGWTGSWQFSLGDERPRWRTVERTFETENPVDEARVYIDMAAGDLNIRGGSATLGRGEFRSAARVLTSISEENGRAILRVRQSGAAKRERADFDVALADQVPLTLDLKVEDADVQMDASELSIRKLYLDIAEGIASMTLGRTLDSVWASLSTGEASLLLRLPREAGIRFEGGRPPADADFGTFTVVDQDSILETEGFADAPVRFTIRIEKPVSVLKLEPY